MIHVRWVERKISLKSRGKNRKFILGNITNDIVNPSCKVLWLNKNSHKEHWGERNYAHSKFRSFFFNIWSNSRSDLLDLEKFYKLLKSWSTYWIILFESFFFPLRRIISRVKMSWCPFEKLFISYLTQCD